MPSEGEPITVELGSPEARRGSQMLLGLGSHLRQQGKLQAARRVLARAEELDPDAEGPTLLLSAVCTTQGDHREAVRLAAALAKRCPDNMAHVMHLSRTLTEAGLREPARRLLEQVLKHPGARERALADLSVLDIQEGNPIAAYERLSAHLEKSDCREPALVNMYARICLELDRGSDSLQALSACRADLAGGSEDHRLLSHALGDCLHQVGRHTEALSAYHDGNKGHVDYEPGTHHALVETLRTTPLPSPRPEADTGDRLIFLVGMPRAGTGLIEQILSRHSEVFACGERAVLPQAARLARLRFGLSEQRIARSLPESLVHDMRRAYLTPLSRVKGVQYFTDKRADNYLRLGFITQLFPGARVIHCTREPLDTCFSCYAQNFGEVQPFSRKLAWIGRRYADYAALMESQWPMLGLRKHTVCYEELVRNPEPQVRALLSFLELPFESACLRPDGESRLALANTATPVMQPLHTRAVGRAAPYRPHLASLLKELGSLIEEAGSSAA